MKISYRWLRELIEFDLTIKELAEKLTFAGIEVEAVEALGATSNGLGASDWRLELEVTPNRPDCLSLIGIAREIRALCGGKIDHPDCSVTEAGPEIDTLARLSVEDQGGCPRYLARVIRGVRVAQSPRWLREKLESVGLRPINNVADITNYVLYLLGHPLHAFDYDRLAGQTIIVRRAKAGESLVTLDGVERKLSPEQLVIADARSPVAIAGIMGGAESEISESTRNVLLESAYFDPVIIRQGSRALGIKTDASYRFERGADPLALAPAVDLAARLIAELAGGEVARGRIDASAKTFPESWQIELRPRRVEELLGIEIATGKMLEILEALELRAELSGQTIKVTIPSFRSDLQREVDLIEELARIHGYDKLPDANPSPWSVPARSRPKDAGLRRISQTMAGLGFCEHYGLPMVDPRKLEKFWPGANILRLANPLSSEMSALRPGLLPDLLEALALNRNNGQVDVRLFETGLIYGADAQGTPYEEMMLGAVATGRARCPAWDDKGRDYDFYDLKGLAEALLGYLQLGAEVAAPGPKLPPYFFSGRAAEIRLDGEAVGFLGELETAAVQVFGLEGRIYYLELGLSRLQPALTRPAKRFREIPRHPAVKRDLAVVVEETVDYGSVRKAVYEAGRPELEWAEAFDLYRGQQVGAGRKSLALSLRFRAQDRTITDQEAEAAQQRIVQALRRRFGAEIRQ